MRGVRFSEVTFWDAVVGEEEEVVVLVEVGLGGLDEGVYVGGLFVEGLEGGGFDIGGEVEEGVMDLDYGGFVAAHGVVGVEGDDEEVCDVVSLKVFDGLGYGGFAVGHGEFDGEGGEVLEFFL